MAATKKYRRMQLADHSLTNVAYDYDHEHGHDSLDTSEPAGPGAFLSLLAFLQPNVTADF
jgi:hypothetical protein